MPRWESAPEADNNIVSITQFVILVHYGCWQQSLYSHPPTAKFLTAGGGKVHRKLTTPYPISHFGPLRVVAAVALLPPPTAKFLTAGG
ncbi:Hypothetical predicted protein [Mytilus galloprovincialis]|uniref:Uncharacterized protein n=1 Tax=Mytilus galloprovincialis TaxID=29158 RepID=A0A8B6FM70_MYTGA|nr:Hypothetical predicted protein [Mytilus galloprovincialis]